MTPVVGDKSRRLLVTGASGLLGWNVASAAVQSGWSVTGVRRREDRSQMAAPWHWITCDLTTSSNRQLLFESCPTAIVHCAAEADAHRVEKHSAESAAINIDAVDHLAQLAQRHRVRFIQVSTSLVFGGDNAPYSEDARPDPLSEYGRQKAASERASLDAGGAVCRLPLLLGAGAKGPQGVLEWLLRQMRSGATLFTDEFRAPLSTPYAAQGLLLAAEQCAGVWHLAGERISRHAMGELIARVWRIEDAAIIPKLREELELAAPRPHDVTLRCDRAIALGFSRPSLRQQLTELRATLDDE